MLNELLKEFNLPVSPILEFAIKEKIESYSNDDLHSEEQVVHKDDLQTNPIEMVLESKRKSTIIRVIRDDGSYIECVKAAHTMSQAIKEIGGNRVYDLKIPMDGMHLVTIGGNPLYPTAQHDIGNGYFVNVHSNTLTKKRQLEKIFSLLNLSWKVEVI